MAAHSLPTIVQSLRRSTSGSVAVQAALLLLLMLGFVALGVEVSQLLLAQRKQQSVADSAVMAAATALGTSDPTAEAKAVTASLGYKHGTNSVTVTVSNPPTSGAHASDSKYVQVVVAQAFSPGLIGLFRTGNYTVRARSLAVRSVSTSACLVSLDTSSASALYIDNNAIVNMPGCGMLTNSASNSSVDLRNNAKLTGSVTTAGDVAIANGATVSGSINKHAGALTDPYASVVLPAKPSSKLAAASKPSSALSPGWYDQGWDFDNNANVTLNPGVYWVDTKLSLGNNVTITGTGGVTIIINGNYPIDTGNGTTINITAPTSGNTQGIALYSSKNNSSSVVQNFKNNNVLTVKGAIYFPSQTAYFSNNLATTASTCTQVIAAKISVQNNANLTFNSSCTGVGTTSVGGTTAPGLVE